MRSAFVALLVSTSLLFAGCADDGDDHDHDAYTCPDGTELHLEDFPDHEDSTFNPLSKCPKQGSSTDSTSQAPNVLPVLSLKITDDGGNETPVTLLMGNLTFDATGSMDPDGSITGIAVSVTDSNTTRTASLYDAATNTFKPATFKFDRPGIVNVTVAMVDNRAGFTVNQTHVYVNHLQVLAAKQIPLPGGGASDGCSEGPGGEIVGASYFKPFQFTLGPGATLVEATAVAGGPEIPMVGPAPATAVITICSPAGEAVSEAGEGATVSNAPLPPPVGVESYMVGATLTQTSSPQSQVTVTVLVHYEPQGDAPAAAEE